MKPAFTAPMLELLNFEQLTWLVNGVSPEVFYRQANAFDQGAGHLYDVAQRFRRQLRFVDAVSSGEAFERTMEASERVVADNARVVQALVSPGYGAALRKAGDSLAEAQRRIRDLQMQRGVHPGAPGQQPALPTGPDAAPAAGADKPEAQMARRIVLDLSTAYAEAGSAMTPLRTTGPGSADVAMGPTSMSESLTSENASSGGIRQAVLTSSDVEGAAPSGQGRVSTDAAVLGRPTAVPGRQDTGTAGGGAAYAQGAVAGEGWSMAPEGAVPWLALGATAGPAVLGQQRKQPRNKTTWKSAPGQSEQEGQPSVLGRTATTPEQRTMVDGPAGETAQPEENRPVTESSDVERNTPESDAERRNQPSDVSEHATAGAAASGPQGGPQHATATASEQPHGGTKSTPPPSSEKSADPNLSVGSSSETSLTTATSSGPSSTKTAPSSALDLVPPSGGNGTSLFAPPSGTGSTSSGVPMGGGVAPEGPVSSQSGSGQSGMPMSPMMMGAGMAGVQSQGPREVTTPLGADPETWREGAGVPGALGRPVAEPVEEEASDGQTSGERVDEILRGLRERGKIR